MHNIHTETININSSKSYLAYPTDTDKPVPGVLVIPEFWGLTEYIQKRTRQLAELGHCALAADVYGEGRIAEDVESASSAMDNLFANLDKHFQWLISHIEELKKHRQTDETRIAAMGYCMGGALALHLARKGVDVNGVVSFHGDLSPHTTIAPHQIKAKVLVCHGEADPFIPQEQVDNFKKEMDAGGVDYKFVNYPGALHAFTNPLATENGKNFNLPIAYHEQADRSSWKEMQSFFNRIF